MLQRLFKRQEDARSPREMSDAQLYAALMNGKFGLRWPEEKLQKGYTGTCGVDLVHRTRTFINMLAKDGALKENWRGLDYGCGWGRMASILLGYGKASQLDLCDAWPKTLQIISELGYENHIFPVSELLQPHDISDNTYDFIYSFSVFTHLSTKAFEHNIPMLLKALKPEGKLYFTVRHEEFIDHKYKDRAKELKALLAQQKFVFVDSGGDITGAKLFGDIIITKEYLDQFGKVEYLGQPHSLQHVYALSKEV